MTRLLDNALYQVAQNLEIEPQEAAVGLLCDQLILLTKEDLLLLVDQFSQLKSKASMLSSSLLLVET